MVSFNEMHGFFYEFKATFSPNVCFYCITADQILSLYCILEWSCFSEFEFQIKGKIVIISSPPWKVVILAFRIINLQIYRTTLHIPHFWRKFCVKTLYGTWKNTILTFFLVLIIGPNEWPDITFRTKEEHPAKETIYKTTAKTGSFY